MRRLITAVLALAAAAGLAAPAMAAGVPGWNRPVCGTGWVSVHVSGQTYYNVYNASPAINATCIVSEEHHASWYVSAARAIRSWGYPNISSGWEWGRYTCTGHSGACYRYPVEEEHDGMPRTSVVTHEHPGAYNTAYDIWFDRTSRRPAGQDDGTEVMIWLNHPGVGLHGVTGRAVIGGIAWTVMAWTARANGRSWHYVAYVAQRQRSSVSGLWLNPFFRHAIAHGWLSPHWWLTGIDFGWELVRGGKGNDVASYSLTGLR